MKNETWSKMMHHGHFSIVIILSMGSLGTHATHDPAGYSTWAPVPGNTNQISVAWRFGYSTSGLLCNQDIIDARLVLGDSEQEWCCVEGCPGTSSKTRLSIICTDFNQELEVMSGISPTTVFPISDNQVKFEMETCCASSLIYKDDHDSDRAADYYLALYADLTPRSDNGNINTSPVPTYLIQEIRVQQNCPTTIMIPVTDVDGDDVRCRWATGDDGDFAQPPTDVLNINEKTCTLTVDEPTTGVIGVALAIEDFLSTSSVKALSTIPFMFVIEVNSQAESCNSRPVLISPSPADASEIDVVQNQPVTIEIHARRSSTSFPIKGFSTSSPPGMAISDLKNLPGSNDVHYVTAEWTPDSSQAEPFCFAAFDDNQHSEPWCITLKEPADTDNDGVYDEIDNCNDVENAEQGDTDGDGDGDVCDDDDDDDGLADDNDNCSLNANVNQLDTDSDGQGDICDIDDDNDYILDVSDNCPLTANTVQTDNDADTEGDECDQDDDNDDITDDEDNCPLTVNSNQSDNDLDNTGDVCDNDDDDDGVNDEMDNCPLISNTDQLDTDLDNEGNECDIDDDNDGFFDEFDNCPSTINIDQTDTDNDKVGDMCDNDDDNDGVNDAMDNCPLIFNTDQLDTDLDNEGNECDIDDDNDGLVDVIDNCDIVTNTDQLDTDRGGDGDACDDDDDNDGISDSYPDNCRTTFNPDQLDQDNDGSGDLCDDDTRVPLSTGAWAGIGIAASIVLILAGGLVTIGLVRAIRQQVDSRNLYDAPQNLLQSNNGDVLLVDAMGNIRSPGTGITAPPYLYSSGSIPMTF